MKHRFTRISLILSLSIIIGIFNSTPALAMELNESDYESALIGLSDPELIFEQDDLAFQQSIGLTDDEILQLYEDYLASIPSTMALEEDFSTIQLEGFADYAVEIGIIEDTVVQRAAITKAVVRAEFKVVVAGGNLCGYTTAATLLNHSLQDSPSSLSYGSTSSIATQITDSSEYKSIINDFKSKVSGTTVTYKSYTGSTTLNSTTDLHLAYNKVSYSVVGRKSNNKWTVTVTFSDTYDFETQAWTNSMTDNKVVTILNNYAAYAQSIGAIVPYNVTITTQTTY